MRKPPLSPKTLLDRVRNAGASKVKVAITDIDGVLRGKYLHLDKFVSASESGFGFCNVVFGWDAADICYDNARYTGWHTGYPDALVRLDPNTYREVPGTRRCRSCSASSSRRTRTSHHSPSARASCYAA
jgi:glutamine synthetase